MSVDMTLPCFDPLLIARSGQCFRIGQSAPNEVTACLGARCVRVTALGGDHFRFDCSPEEMHGLWYDYFDLAGDYGAIEAEAMRLGEPLAGAARACHGLRILRQEPWETLVSFILSQRKSIPAISACVAKLCERFGEPCAPCFGFPSPEALLSAGEDGLRSCGVGYRAEYLLDASRCVMLGRLPLDTLSVLTDDELLARLLSVKGVGIKVASCVALFAYHRLSISPVDVWIQRVIDEDYGGVSPFRDFGAHAGVFQQYLFLSRLTRAHSA